MQTNVSIIIPAYNSERSIGRCLESILAQKTKYKYEVITVCDPSTDDTLKIIETYTRKYKNFHNINVTTRSIGLARARGIEEAKGKYLMFIDSDDYYKDSAIETMVKTIEDEKADIVASSFYYVKNKKIKKNFFSKDAVYNQKEMLKALMKDSYMHGFMWNKIYKSELLQGKHYVLPTGNIIREDVLTNFQIFLNCQKLVLISQPLYFYDKTYESTTSQKDKNRIPWFINIFAIERYLLEKEKPSYIKMYRSLNARRKLLLFGDQLIVKRAYDRKEFKELKNESNKYLKILNKKDNLTISRMPWESFIKESFKDK